MTDLTFDPAFVAVLSLMHAFAAVIVIYFLTQVRGLTPKVSLPDPYNLIAEKLIRTGVCIAWLIYMVTEVFAAATIFLGASGQMPLAEVRENISASVLLAHLSGTIILIHFAWLAWRADFRRRLQD